MILSLFDVISVITQCGRRRNLISKSNWQNEALNPRPLESQPKYLITKHHCCFNIFNIDINLHYILKLETIWKIQYFDVVFTSEAKTFIKYGC